MADWDRLCNTVIFIFYVDAAVASEGKLYERNAVLKFSAFILWYGFREQMVFEEDAYFAQ